MKLQNINNRPAKVVKEEYYTAKGKRLLAAGVPEEEVNPKYLKTRYEERKTHVVRSVKHIN